VENPPRPPQKPNSRSPKTGEKDLGRNPKSEVKKPPTHPAKAPRHPEYTGRADILLREPLFVAREFVLFRPLEKQINLLFSLRSIISSTHAKQ
jgi:hypothetical protein